LNQYEAMFLFDPTFGGSFENCESVVRRLMERAEAEILFCRKWDERRLAYKIKGRKRGVYVLVYFQASAGKVGSIERDARITEEILRLLILRADGVTREAMEGSYVQKTEAEGSEDTAGSRGAGGNGASRRSPSDEREVATVAVAKGRAGGDAPPAENASNMD